MGADSRGAGGAWAWGGCGAAARACTSTPARNSPAIMRTPGALRSMYTLASDSALSPRRPTALPPSRPAVRERQVEDAVERVDDAREAAAPHGVDDRIARRQKHVAGHDHVRSAKVHHAVAVGMGRRLMEDLKRFAVEPDFSRAGEVGFRRQGAGGGGPRRHARGAPPR